MNNTSLINSWKKHLFCKGNCVIYIETNPIHDLQSVCDAGRNLVPIRLLHLHRTQQQIFLIIRPLLYQWRASGAPHFTETIHTRMLTSHRPSQWLSNSVFTVQQSMNLGLNQYEARKTCLESLLLSWMHRLLSVSLQLQLHQISPVQGCQYLALYDSALNFSLRSHPNCKLHIQHVDWCWKSIQTANFKIHNFRICLDVMYLYIHTSNPTSHSESNAKLTQMER